MGYRLSKLYTRTGDDGSTGLADGSRVEKSAPRIEAMGDADELNCHVGMLFELLPAEDSIRPLLERIQHHLFDLGGEFAIPGSEIISPEHVAWVEQELDRLNEPLPPLKNFILPAGSVAAAQAHMARGVCRRAERTMVEMGRQESINPLGRQYLNRLSDFLFVVARTLARREGAKEVLWNPELAKMKE